MAPYSDLRYNYISINVLNLPCSFIQLNAVSASSAYSILKILRCGTYLRVALKRRRCLFQIKRVIRISKLYDCVSYYHSRPLPSHACVCDTDFFYLTLHLIFLFRLFNKSREALLLNNLNEVDTNIQERKVEKTERFSPYFQSSEFSNTGIFITIAELI